MFRTNHIVMLLMSWLLLQTVQAQVDTNYVKLYKGRLIIEPFIRFRTSDVSLVKDGQPLLFSQKNATGVGLRVMTSLGGTSATLPLTQSKDNLLSNSREIGAAGMITVKGHTIFGSARHIRGLGLNDGMESVFREDIRWLGLEGGVVYAFNNNRYRYNAPIRFPKWQRKSAGSPLMAMAININYFWGRSGVFSLVNMLRRYPFLRPIRVLASVLDPVMVTTGYHPNGMPPLLSWLPVKYIPPVFIPRKILLGKICWLLHREGM
jgi:hypothetical protein